MVNTKHRNHSGNIRPHGNGYEASVSVDGKRLYFHADTKAQAEAIVRSVVRSSLTASAKESPKNASVTVEESAIGWLLMLSDLKINTQYGHERILHLYILPYFGTHTVSTMTTQDVQDFIEDLKNEGKSPKTIKNIVSVLSAILGYAVRHNILLFNPVRGVKLPQVHNIGHTPQVMDVDYYYLLYLIKTENPKFADLFLIALLTGMRRSELKGLTWDKIDFKQRTITIDSQLQYNRLTHKGHFQDADKSYNGRTIVMTRRVHDCLQKIKEDQNQQIAEGNYENSRGFVFVNMEGRHLSDTQIQEAFRNFIDSHPELPHMRFHDLRGSFATHAHDIGINPKIIAYILGHRDVAFTMNRYARVSRRQQDSAALMLENDLSLFDDLDDKGMIGERLKSLIEKKKGANKHEKDSL